ncbi:MAG: hypothetical protein RL695_1092, partial [Pseudomonadota bacterium]
AGGTPGFFFINPAGVAFGTGAAVDVPGAFYVSTANYVKFPDGNFYADTASSSTFSSASPEAFGFLAGGRATVQAINTNPQGAPGQPVRPSLFVGTDKSIQIVAGDVTIDNSVIGNESGDVRVVVLGRPQQDVEVALSGAHQAAYGDLTIRHGGQINSSTNSRKDVGSVDVYAGNIVIDRNGAQRDTGIISQADRGASGKTGQLNIFATGDMTLLKGAKVSANNGAVALDPTQLSAGRVTVRAKNITLDQSEISAETGGNVEASHLDLHAQGNVTLDNGAAIKGTTSGSGNASSIVLVAGGDLTLSNGAFINGNTALSGQAAAVNISAANVTLDGMGRSAIISSEANAQRYTEAATGSGNRVDIATPGRLTLANGGQIKSSTNTKGNAGDIRVRAGEIDIDGQDNTGVQTGIVSTTIRSGDSGDIDLASVGALRVRRLGEVNASAYGPAGKAGTIRIDSGSLSVDGMKAFHGTITLPDGTLRAVDGFKSSAISSEAGSNSAGRTGDVTISVAGDMRVSNGAQITVSNLAMVADPGQINGVADDRKPNLTMTAGSLVVDGKGMITASTRGNVDASRVVVATTTGDIELKNGGTLQASTGGAGNAGTIAVKAARNLVLTAGGNILDSTSAEGHAGSVRVRANEITIDGQAQLQTGIFSTASRDARGAAGEIMVAAQGDLTLRGGGQLSVQNDAYAQGGVAASPSALLVLARNMSLSGEQTQITAASSGNLDASPIKIAATGGTVIEDHPDFATLAASGSLSIGRGSSINGNTSGSGRGASIAIKAGTVTLDGAGGIASISSESMRSIVATQNVTGDGGSVEIVASRLLLNNGGQIKTSTMTAGHAGVASLVADSILIDGGNNPQVLTGIIGSTNSAGDSGKLSVSAKDDLSIVRLGQIGASTNGAGQAGNIFVQGGNVLIDGKLNVDHRDYASNISAEAGPASSGRTGNLSVTATRNVTLSRGGRLSVQNYANVSPSTALALNDSAVERSRISISAPDITLINAQISAASLGNVNASNIDIAFANKLYLDPSAISTSANGGDGGAIDIRGGRLMVLDNSMVSTSVTGLVGFNGNPANGGDIHVMADTLLLQSGFIQANTAASNASGGNVTLALKNLVPSGNTLYLGGQTAYGFVPYVFGFNVIQAAAPTGLSGTIQISSPTLDLAGALSGLKASMVDSGGLGRSPCQAAAGSSFVQAGRGGFAPSARELMGPESLNMPGALPDLSKPLALERIKVECDQR